MSGWDQIPILWIRSRGEKARAVDDSIVASKGSDSHQKSMFDVMAAYYSTHAKDKQLIPYGTVDR